jgi:hypothetical protein
MALEVIELQGKAPSKERREKSLLIEVELEIG